jgi:hypothetical protein
MSKELTMTIEEAYILHAHHKAREKSEAATSNYAKAAGHKERAALIGRVFWPADEWERAWSQP